MILLNDMFCMYLVFFWYFFQQKEIMILFLNDNGPICIMTCIGYKNYYFSRVVLALIEMKESPLTKCRGS